MCGWITQLMFLRDAFQIRRPINPGLRRTIMATYLTFEYLLGLIAKKKIQVTFVIIITWFSWTANSWLRQAFRRPGKHPKQKRWWATRPGTAARWPCRACAFNVSFMGNNLPLYTYRINWQDLSLVQDSLVMEVKCLGLIVTTKSIWMDPEKDHVDSR